MVGAQAPIEVYPAAKEKIRYAVAMRGVSQAELLAQVVDEDVARHRDEFAERINDARAALLDGENAAVAQMLGVDKHAVRPRCRLLVGQREAGNFEPRQPPLAGPVPALFEVDRVGGVEKDREEDLAGPFVDELARPRLDRDGDPQFI